MSELRSFKEWCDLRKSDEPQPYTFKELTEFAKATPAEMAGRRAEMAIGLDNRDIPSPSADIDYKDASDNAFDSHYQIISSDDIDPARTEEEFLMGVAGPGYGGPDSVTPYPEDWPDDPEVPQNEADGSPDALEDKDMAGEEAQMETTLKSDDSKEEACVDFDKVIKSLTAKGYSEDQIIGAFDRIVKSATENFQKNQDLEEKYWKFLTDWAHSHEGYTDRYNNMVNKLNETYADEKAAGVSHGWMYGTPIHLWQLENPGVSKHPHEPGSYISPTEVSKWDPEGPEMATLQYHYDTHPGGGNKDWYGQLLNQYGSRRSEGNSLGSQLARMLVNHVNGRDPVTGEDNFPSAIDED